MTEMNQGNVVAGALKAKIFAESDKRKIQESEHANIEFFSVVFRLTTQV